MHDQTPLTSLELEWRGEPSANPPARNAVFARGSRQSRSCLLAEDDKIIKLERLTAYKGAHLKTFMKVSHESFLCSGNSRCLLSGRRIRRRGQRLNCGYRCYRARCRNVNFGTSRGRRIGSRKGGPRDISHAIEHLDYPLIFEIYWIDTARSFRPPFYGHRMRAQKVLNGLHVALSENI
jgi:hypothetical protein